MRILTLTVTPAMAGQRVGILLRRELHISSTLLKSLKWRENAILRNGQPVTDSGLCDAMNFNDLQNAVGRLSDNENLHMMQLSQGLSSVGYENLRNFADTQASVKDGDYALSRQMADCCCTTQRAIDSVNANIDAKFAALEKSQLEGRIAQLEQANNQLYIREQMYGVVRYPNGYTYSAGASPFCGGCCGNGNI